MARFVSSNQRMFVRSPMPSARSPCRNCKHASIRSHLRQQRSTLIHDRAGGIPTSWNRCSGSTPSWSDSSVMRHERATWFCFHSSREYETPNRHSFPANAPRNTAAPCPRTNSALDEWRGCFRRPCLGEARVRGRVDSVHPFGVFVDIGLDPGIPVLLEIIHFKIRQDQARTSNRIPSGSFPKSARDRSSHPGVFDEAACCWAPQLSHLDWLHSQWLKEQHGPPD